MIASEDERPVFGHVFGSDHGQTVYPSEKAAEPSDKLFIKRHFRISYNRAMISVFSSIVIFELSIITASSAGTQGASAL